MTTLSARLKQLRNERHLLQKDIAKVLNITTSAYGFYEQGKRIPDSVALSKMADFFNVSLDYLMGNTDLRTFCTVPKVEKLEYDDFMESIKLHFLDADEADRDAIFRDISNIYFESKDINKKKYAPNKNKEL